MPISNSPSTARTTSPSDVLRQSPRPLRPKSASKRPDGYHPPERVRSAGRPPEGQGFWNTLLHPFAPEQRRRHKAKQQARQMVGQAIDLIYQDNKAGSHAVLRDFIRHCRHHLLDVDHEMARGKPSNLHPVEEILRAGDYDALLVLAPALKSATYGQVFVNRSESGFYIGEGMHEGTGSAAVFKARGHGILMCDGQRTEGEWSNNLPNGFVRHFPKEGPLRSYAGQVKDSKMHGNGKAEFTDGRMLETTWVNEVRDGQGTMTWPNGDHLRAVWRDGVMEAGAIFETRDGRRIEGDIDEETCLPEGQCAITWQCGPQEGAHYEGAVRDGVPHGQGAYMFGAEEVLFGFQYEGPFFKGAKHGVGKLVELATEKKQRCHFANDVLKSPEPVRTEMEPNASEDDLEIED